MNLLNCILCDSGVFVFGLHVIEHHDAGALSVAVEVNAVDPVRLITALE